MKLIGPLIRKRQSILDILIYWEDLAISMFIKPWSIFYYFQVILKNNRKKGKLIAISLRL
jgi:hypothetical protein